MKGNFEKKQNVVACHNGHAWEIATTYVNLKGFWVCRICSRLSQKKSRAHARKRK